MDNRSEFPFRPIFANENVSLHLSNVVSADQLIEDFFSNDGFLLITVGFVKITENKCEHLYKSGDYIPLPVRLNYINVQIDKVTDILWLKKNETRMRENHLQIENCQKLLVV